MPAVETVRGPVSVASLGPTLMHEHVFVLSEEIRRNYPGRWDSQHWIAHAADRLNQAARLALIC
jgi:phosphotriesterase-related protein